MLPIENIIFDLGGVFIDIHYEKTRQTFLQLGINQFDKFFQQQHANALFKDLEKGLISKEVFFAEFRTATKSSITDEQITTAWNAMLGAFRTKAIQWLDTLKGRYNLFLFSNTNEIHYDAFAEKFHHQFHRRIESYFDTAYFSHKLHMRKPDTEGFYHILKTENLVPGHTIFIDDTESNIIAAQKTNMQTYWLTHPKQVEAIGL